MEGIVKVIQPRVPFSCQIWSKLGVPLKWRKLPRLPRGIRPLEPTNFIPSLEKTFATALHFQQKASLLERSFLLWLLLDSVIAVFLFFVLCRFR